MILTFDTNGNEKQKEVCRHWAGNDVSDIVYGGSKGSGKSYLGCSLIFSSAYMYPETHWFIARKHLNDLRRYTIPSIHEVFNHWKLSDKYHKYNGQDNYFHLHNGSKVFFLDTSYQPGDPDYARFGSMQMTGGWMEESGEQQEEAMNNLSASIGRWKNDVYGIHGKLLQTCNPAKNYLYKNYYKPNKDNTIDPWKKFIQALPTDNKKLPAGYLLHLERTLNSNQKERLLHGNWEYDDDPSAMCDYEKIISIFKNDFESLKGDKYITADIARLGSDKIVIGLWNGLRCEKIYVYSKLRINESSDIIDKIRKENNVPISNVICDEDGVGGGVVDLLKCVGFVNNSKALHGDNYENLQAQCAYKLADKINEAGIYVAGVEGKQQEEVIEELEHMKQKNIDTDGRRGIMNKEHVKSLIGRSPDYRDMLLMRMYFELRPPVKRHKPVGYTPQRRN